MIATTEMPHETSWHISSKIILDIYQSWRCSFGYLERITYQQQLNEELINNVSKLHIVNKEYEIQTVFMIDSIDILRKLLAAKNAILKSTLKRIKTKEQYGNGNFKSYLVFSLI